MTPSEDVPGDVPLGPQLSGVRTARADAATVRRSTCKLAEIDHLRCFWFFRDITKFHLNANNMSTAKYGGIRNKFEEMISLEKGICRLKEKSWKL